MSTLTQIVIAHHMQANYMARKTLRCQKPIFIKLHSGIHELERIGNKFTTRVEKRLRKLESTK